MLDRGSFTTSFFIIAFGIAISSIIYWKIFRPLEIPESQLPTLESESDFKLKYRQTFAD
jgi:hypothetical protein